MFSLQKSFAKLQESLQETNLVKKEFKNNKNNDGSNEEVTDFTSRKKMPNKKTLPIQKNFDNQDDENRSVVLIKNFPHGFYEQQMFDYFSQFGEVTRLKILRSRKTGNPRSHGFIEFRFKEVAQIAADTMNNYVMFDHILKCTVLPDEKVPRGIFRNWNKPFMSTVKKHKLAHNRDKSANQEYRTICNHLRRVHKIEEALSKKGLDFKCVVVNRPQDLKKTSEKKGVSKPRSSLKRRPLLEPPGEHSSVIVNLPTPRISTRKVNRLSLPKFRKLRAASVFRA